MRNKQQLSTISRSYKIEITDFSNNVFKLLSIHISLHYQLKKKYLKWTTNMEKCIKDCFCFEKIYQNISKYIKIYQNISKYIKYIKKLLFIPSLAHPCSETSICSEAWQEQAKASWLYYQVCPSLNQFKSQFF